MLTFILIYLFTIFDVDNGAVFYIHPNTKVNYLYKRPPPNFDPFAGALTVTNPVPASTTTEAYTTSDIISTTVAPTLADTSTTVFTTPDWISEINIRGEEEATEDGPSTLTTIVMDKETEEYDSTTTTNQDSTTINAPGSLAISTSTLIPVSITDSGDDDETVSSSPSGTKATTIDDTETETGSGDDTETDKENESDTDTTQTDNQETTTDDFTFSITPDWVPKVNKRDNEESSGDDLASENGSTTIKEEHDEERANEESSGDDSDTEDESGTSTITIIDKITEEPHSTSTINDFSFSDNDENATTTSTSSLVISISTVTPVGSTNEAISSDTGSGDDDETVTYPQSGTKATTITESEIGSANDNEIDKENNSGTDTTQTDNQKATTDDFTFSDIAESSTIKTGDSETVVSIATEVTSIENSIATFKFSNEVRETVSTDKNITLLTSIVPTSTLSPFQNATNSDSTTTLKDEVPVNTAVMSTENSTTTTFEPSIAITETRSTNTVSTTTVEPSRNLPTTDSATTRETEKEDNGRSPVSESTDPSNTQVTSVENRTTIETEETGSIAPTTISPLSQNGTNSDSTQVTEKEDDETAISESTVPSNTQVTSVENRTTIETEETGSIVPTTISLLAQNDSTTTRMTEAEDNTFEFSIELEETGTPSINISSVTTVATDNTTTTTRSEKEDNSTIAVTESMVPIQNDTVFENGPTIPPTIPTERTEPDFSGDTEPEDFGSGGRGDDEDNFYTGSGSGERNSLEDDTDEPTGGTQVLPEAKNDLI